MEDEELELLNAEQEAAYVNLRRHVLPLTRAKKGCCSRENEGPMKSYFMFCSTPNEHVLLGFCDHHKLHVFSTLHRIEIAQHPLPEDATTIHFAIRAGPTTVYIIVFTNTANNNLAIKLLEVTSMGDASFIQVRFTMRDVMEARTASYPFVYPTDEGFALKEKNGFNYTFQIYNALQLLDHWRNDSSEHPPFTEFNFSSSLNLLNGLFLKNRLYCITNGGYRDTALMSISMSESRAIPFPSEGSLIRVFEFVSMPDKDKILMLEGRDIIWILDTKTDLISQVVNIRDPSIPPVSFLGHRLPTVDKIWILNMLAYDESDGSLYLTCRELLYSLRQKFVGHLDSVCRLYLTEDSRFIPTLRSLCIDKIAATFPEKWRTQAAHEMWKSSPADRIRREACYAAYLMDKLTEGKKRRVFGCLSPA